MLPGFKSPRRLGCSPFRLGSGGEAPWSKVNVACPSLRTRDTQRQTSAGPGWDGRRSWPSSLSTKGRAWQQPLRKWLPVTSLLPKPTLGVAYASTTAQAASPLASSGQACTPASLSLLGLSIPFLKVPATTIKSNCNIKRMVLLIGNYARKINLPCMRKNHNP